MLISLTLILFIKIATRLQRQYYLVGQMKRKQTESDRMNFERKSEICADFFVVTGYSYYHGNRIYLNLIDVHPSEKVYFFEKRGEINTKKQIQTYFQSKMKIG